MLIFAQLKSLLDLVQRDVLQPNNVTYVRLDGSVAPKDRFAVVQRFNADPTIDVMLLTTHVGGLGLNLTAADTVVFLEHDWYVEQHWLHLLALSTGTRPRTCRPWTGRIGWVSPGRSTCTGC